MRCCCGGNPHDDDDGEHVEEKPAHGVGANPSFDASRHQVGNSPAATLHEI